MGKSTVFNRLEIQMNCKPGDIAIVRDGPYFGLQVAIIEAAPVGVGFYLPNGVRHSAVGANRWIVEVLSSRPAPLVGGGTAFIGCVGDHRLISIGEQPSAVSRNELAEEGNR
jgi:hypothetical protein